MPKASLYRAPSPSTRVSLFGYSGSNPNLWCLVTGLIISLSRFWNHYLDTSSCLVCFSQCALFGSELFILFSKQGKDRAVAFGALRTLVENDKIKIYKKMTGTGYGWVPLITWLSPLRYFTAWKISRECKYGITLVFCKELLVWPSVGISAPLTLFCFFNTLALSIWRNSQRICTCDHIIGVTWRYYCMT